jgi:hypothetical protein
VRERFEQIKLAFERTREVDPRFVPYLVAAALVGFLVPFLISWLALGELIWGIAFGFLFAPLAAMIVFNRRVSSAQFEAMEGQPGAAAMVLQSMRGPWHVTPAVAFNRKQDLVHRVVGKPGVVLVGEGSRAGVKTLMKSEARKMRRAVGDEVDVHEVIVGEREGEVELPKLRMHVMKLPRSVKKKQVAALETRLAALTDAAGPMPKGPVPTGKAMRGARRRPRRGARPGRPGPVGTRGPRPPTPVPPAPPFGRGHVRAGTASNRHHRPRDQDLKIR